MEYANHCAIFIAVANFATITQLSSRNEPYEKFSTQFCVVAEHRVTNVQKNPSAAPIHAWEYPSKPWERIYIDYA